MTDNSQPSYYQNQDSSVNPAWNDLLSSVPEEYHQALTPHLTNWDKGVNEKFNSIHQDYAPYKQYRENGVRPEDLDLALGTLNQLNDNPLDVYNKLQFYLSQQGMLPTETETTYGQEPAAQNVPDDPRVAELYEGFGTLAEAYLQEQTTRQEAAEDAALERELASMRDKYGEFDEQYVLALMQNGMDTEPAVQAYNAKVDELLQHRNRPSAPRIIGSAGFSPGQPTIDPRKLDDRQSRDLVTDILKSYMDN